MSRVVFETPSFVWFVLILGGLTILALHEPDNLPRGESPIDKRHPQGKWSASQTMVTAFANDSLIFHWPPFVGAFLFYLNSNYKWLLQLTFAAAIVVHLFESYYAYHLAVLLKLPIIDVIKWTVQTAILGFPSLHIIAKKYKEENKYK